MKARKGVRLAADFNLCLNTTVIPTKEPECGKQSFKTGPQKLVEQEARKQ